MIELTVWTFYPVRDVKWPVKGGKIPVEDSVFIAYAHSTPYAFFVRSQNETLMFLLPLGNTEVLIWGTAWM